MENNQIVQFEDNEHLLIRPLGAGQEVGRSCIFVQYKGKKLLLDCGTHPGLAGYESLPYFGAFEDELENIDLVLITHFHIDHCGALPWFLQKTNFKGRCFMTAPTKAVYKYTLSDYMRVINVGAEMKLYTEKDIKESLKKIETIDFHKQVEVDGIKFKCYHAGHVLGAAMFMIEIAGVKLLYTGDLCREESRHLVAAEIPEMTPDVLIVESTFGTQVHENRVVRESRFVEAVDKIVNRGGNCLIPASALGNVQELLLILDEHWAACPKLKKIPIYYLSSLAKKCMNVYRSNVNAMNERIRQQCVHSNPFDFKHVSHIEKSERIVDGGPCVVLAAPGMMQSGVSRKLLETWCGDQKNGVIIAGYCVEGTLANHILSEPEEIYTAQGKKLPMKCSVDYISFSFHTDYEQTSGFIRELKPSHIILVHGEQHEMKKMKDSLVRENNSYDIRTPRNGELLRLLFKRETLPIVDENIVKNHSFANQNATIPVIAHDTLSVSPSNMETQNVVVCFSGTFQQLYKCMSLISEDIDIIRTSSKDGYPVAPAQLRLSKTVIVEFEEGMVTLGCVHGSENNILIDSLTKLMTFFETNIFPVTTG